MGWGRNSGLSTGKIFTTVNVRRSRLRDQLKECSLKDLCGRQNPLRPHMEEGGSDDYGHGQVIDNVKVPAGLEPGEYVLGFRWDSKCSPQVWSSCSNLLII